MNKNAITGFTSAYAHNIGRKPWLEGGVLGSSGAFLGYHGMNFVIPALLKVLLIDKSPADRRKILDEYQSDGTLQLLKKLGAGMGLAAGVGYAAQKHLDFGSGFAGLLGSAKDSRYWNTDQGRARNKEIREAKLKSRTKDSIEKSRPLSTGSGNISMGPYKYTQKRGSQKDYLFSSERIAVSGSLNLVNADPFLTLTEKQITGMVLEGAEGTTSGLISGRDIARSAVNAGVGAGVGIVLGKTMGALFSLPSPVTRRLSVAGAIAGALTNTGLFSEVRQ
jgi:hypothetical protein